MCSGFLDQAMYREVVRSDSMKNLYKIVKVCECYDGFVVTPILSYLSFLLP